MSPHVRQSLELAIALTKQEKQVAYQLAEAVLKMPDAPPKVRQLAEKLLKPLQEAA
jgi:hypothetical protein